MDPYLYPNTTVLRNLRNLRDPDDLARFEADISFFRSIELERTPIPGYFDIDHLCAIHRHLFGDVYAWAGTFRTVDISKGDSLFAIHRFIVPSLVATFDELKGERFLSGLAVERFCKRTAYYLSELNAVHPFREGNGRTQREFLRELALACDYRLDWTKTTKAEMAEASRESLRKGSRMLEPLIQRVTSRITNY